MIKFFPAYSKHTTYNVTVRQEFDSCLDKFLNRNRVVHPYTDINQEFQEIENFLTHQPVDFFEETFFITCSKIIKNLSSYAYDDKQISSAQIFVNMLKQDKFKNLFSHLDNYGTIETFEFIDFLLKNNNIFLAENITSIFIPPEKRTLKSFTKNNIIDWCLKNTKISALRFLINNYEGFNDKNIQNLFLSYGELGEEYLSKVFPDNIYPNSLESSFQNFFKNPSIVLFKKLELVSYFSKKSDFIPKEIVLFIYSCLSENIISIDSLKKHDFFNKLTSKKTISFYLSYSTSNYIKTLKNYLSLFDNNDDNANDNKIPSLVFDILLINPKKENVTTILNDFIKEFPDFAREKSQEIQEYIIKNNLDMNLSSLKSALVLDDNFNNYLINKNINNYFFLKNPDTDPEYFNKCVKYIQDNGCFPPLPSETFYQPIGHKLFKVFNNEQLVNLFFLGHWANLSNSMNFFKNTQFTIVIDLLSISEHNKERLMSNLKTIMPDKLLEELKPKKWYNFTSEKPLQIVFKKGLCSIIKNPNDKVILTNNEIDDTENSSSLSIALSQAKKDLLKFNQLTSEPLNFNLEFKIRSESIFMQQMNFLTQVQQIEDDLKFEDLYFLKNNLGKYLIQCTETYSRSLKRHQTLVENPGLFKKQDTTLDSQKEKIDNEALKQVTLLEKELNFVKENIIKTINSESYTDMKINTRFLESTVEHNEVNTIVKLVNTKLKQG